MRSATVRIGDGLGSRVSPRLFGALTEHFGYGMYGGLWDVDRNVARSDVQAAVRAAGITLFRYPGGCFSDWYHWRDGIGRAEDRPTQDRTYWTDFRFEGHIDDEMARAFGPVETNQVGTDEFLRYCMDADIEPMRQANFGTGTPDEAAAWVRYCNVDRAAPRPVRWWGIGNETYGDWELGHCSPTEYGVRFHDYAAAMRAEDPGVRLVAVGCATSDSALGEWNAGVLAEAGDVADALSVHWYFPGPRFDRPLRDDESDYLQVAAAPDGLGVMLDAVIEQVDAVVGADRALPLSLDEWNLWATWSELLHANHRLCDAVFFAGCYNRMIERAGRIRFACISHMVNCMAPIQTDGDRHFVTSSYLVGLLYRWSIRDGAVAADVECDTIAIPAFDEDAPERTTLVHEAAPRHDAAPVCDAAATTDDGGATVFLVNRDLSEPMRVVVTGLPATADGRFRHLRGPGPFARNEVNHPDAVGFAEVSVTTDAAGSCEVVVPPHGVGAVIVDRS